MQFLIFVFSAIIACWYNPFSNGLFAISVVSNGYLIQAAANFHLQLLQNLHLCSLAFSANCKRLQTLSFLFEQKRSCPPWFRLWFLQQICFACFVTQSGSTLKSLYKLSKDCSCFWWFANTATDKTSIAPVLLFRWLWLVAATHFAIQLYTNPDFAV